ncbi:MAG: hypothetical protein JGK21_15170 [Microcoleus sp. PH2017_22_RUC_O_B]|uniref:hypothetical protein n=1 Tax=unclassified Microcoleus TaxID=2642155 RepID=UPI001D607B01|nr:MULTISPECIES: hypothetical protein [unclassified Microcoleus]MCC3529528.1 hypothetical protein [Microcoleus sp. PH2017_21_RUC_O_A]MCC3541683.1 hypothetical protein [Microcoleus sp. PH2017_22_RUC_O_B]
MTHEKSEGLKLSHHLPHHHVPHYHYHAPHKHDFPNLGNGLATGTFLAQAVPAATMGSTLAAIAVVAIPVVAIGGLIWWAASQDE